MSDHDPIAEWRTRWQSGKHYPNQQFAAPAYGYKPSRSPWVYAAAAFGGTVAAIVFCIVAVIAIVLLIAANADGFDSTPESLTYHNDTDEVVYVYECYERCVTYQWGFMLDENEEYSFQLEWYYDEPIEWVIVTRGDSSYGCIHIWDWKDQTVSISDAAKCPKDIHSPETEVF